MRGWSAFQFLLILFVFAAPTSGDPPERNEEPAAIEAPVRVGYIYKNDREGAISFKRLLDTEGLKTEMIDLNAIRKSNLGNYAVILIGSDTERSWGQLASLVDNAERPILGLGEGGYSFFGRLHLSIGSPRGWHGRATKLLPVNLSDSRFWAARQIDAPTDKEVAVYEASGHVGIHLPDAVTGVTPIGREVGSGTHYVLIQQTPRYVLWGFTGSPEAMTPAGRDLFVHTCRYVLSLAAQQPRQVFESMTLRDLAAAKYSDSRINGSDNENNELLSGTILAARTSDGRYCKFMIQEYGYNLVICWVTYSKDGAVHSEGSDLKIRGTWQGDLDSGIEGGEGIDFWWEQVDRTERYLVPRNGAQFAILRRPKPTKAESIGNLPIERYAVPDGGVNELLAFIKDLGNFRPKTTQETFQHSQRAPAALKRAATKILKLEKDEWSDAYQTALRVLLEIRINDIPRADRRQQGQTVEFVNTYLKAKVEKRLESLDVDLAVSTARALETSRNLELAAKAYDQFADQIAESGNTEFSKTVKQLKDAAKRLSDAERPH